MPSHSREWFPCAGVKYQDRGLVRWKEVPIRCPPTLLTLCKGQRIQLNGRRWEDLQASQCKGCLGAVSGAEDSVAVFVAHGRELWGLELGNKKQTVRPSERVLRKTPWSWQEVNSNTRGMEMAGGNRTGLSKGRSPWSGSVRGVGLCQEWNTEPIAKQDGSIKELEKRVVWACLGHLIASKGQGKGIWAQTGSSLCLQRSNSHNKTYAVWDWAPQSWGMRKSPKEDHGSSGEGGRKRAMGSWH